jgi:hypothetical protein
LFEYDSQNPPLWDDGDTIAGEVPLGIPDIWGNDIRLGMLCFNVHSFGPTESISLGPVKGDYGIFGEEGLLGATALMPNNPIAIMYPIPEPSTCLLLLLGLIGMVGAKKKFS